MTTRTSYQRKTKRKKKSGPSSPDPGRGPKWWLALGSVGVLLLSTLYFVDLDQTEHLVEAKPRPNVLFITVDTLRADHVSSYDGSNVSTPSIDSLSRQGVQFKTVISPAPLTLPAHCSLFTGTYPLTTGVRDNLGYVLTGDHLTLAEILQQSGYSTAAFVGAYVLDAKWGLDQGFQHFDDDLKVSRNSATGLAIERKGGEVADAALRWIPGNAAAPFFCWIHLFDPHDPYEAPEPFRTRYAGDAYAAEVAYTDHVIGRVLDRLKELRIYDDTVIVLAGDHGEGLGEHQEETHGYFLYDSTLLVPLIIKLHKSYSHVPLVEGPVQLLDVVPTLLQILSLDRPDRLQGRGLLGAILGKEKLGDRAAYSETYYPNEFGWSELRVWRSREYKYVLGPEPELYRLASDPGERRNLIKEKSALAEQYRAALEGFEARYANEKAVRDARAQLSVEDLERFRALGYIGGPTEAKPSRRLLLPDPKQKVEIFSLVSRATTLMARREFPQALDTLQRLLQRDPEMTTGYSLLGQCHLQMGRYKQAQSAFKRVLGKEPDRVYPLFYLGLAHFHLREYENARPLFEKAVSIDPKFFPAYNYLGFIHSDREETEPAIQAFSKAVELQENPQSYQMLGYLYLKNKQLDRAVRAFEKVVVLEPENAMANLYLANAYALQGRTELAQRAYEAAIRLNPKLKSKLPPN